MIIYTLIILAIAVFIFLFLTPIIFEIDSKRYIYQIRIWGIGSMNVIVVHSNICFRLNILGWKKDFYPGQKEKKILKKKEITTKHKKISLKKILHKGNAIIRSFDVKYFYVNLDTDDYVMNAWLYPLATLLSNENRRLSINFLGEVELRLKIENSLQRMLRAYFR